MISAILIMEYPYYSVADDQFQFSSLCSDHLDDQYFLSFSDVGEEHIWALLFGNSTTTGAGFSNFGEVGMSINDDPNSLINIRAHLDLEDWNENWSLMVKERPSDHTRSDCSRSLSKRKCDRGGIEDGEGRNKRKKMITSKEDDRDRSGCGDQMINKSSKLLLSEKGHVLYSRKRREKINQKLKTLQSLVPNTRKIDISTMLEQAILYVKFLQLQIKCLSSDDISLPIPVAFNEMLIGLEPQKPLAADSAKPNDN